jgi:dienelactone hydrolase
MKLTFLLCLLLAALLSPSVCRAELRAAALEYRDGDTVLEGYLAYDDAITGRRPGVLIVHEWKGLTSYEKSRADQLARLGYLALAADIYGKGVRPQTTADAAKVSAVYRDNRPLLRQRSRAALETLRRQELADPNRIAAIGYCFGGATVLELARSGADLSGVVSFHGGLDTPNPATPGSIKCKVLALTGGDDPSVPPDEVLAFEDEMRKAGADWQVNLYGGAVHGFTNPAAGPAYNRQADLRSWQAMRAFFDEIFRAAGEH